MSHNDNTRTHRIVVGVDGSANAEQALRWAATEASLRGDKVEAIAVRERDELLPGTSFTFQPHGRRPVTDEEGTREYLHDAVTAVASAAPITELLRTGDPARELIKASEAADLLVVGSHRHGALAELLLGSTSADCLWHAHCPVVVIPARLTG